MFAAPGDCPPANRLYTMAPDGSDRRLLAGVNAEYPDWSPDGSMVAFDDGAVVCTPDWFGQAGHVYAVNADGSGHRRLSTGNGTELTPDWSPDGRHVAVTPRSPRTAGPGSPSWMSTTVA